MTKSIIGVAGVRTPIYFALAALTRELQRQGLKAAKKGKLGLKRNKDGSFTIKLTSHWVEEAGPANGDESMIVSGFEQEFIMGVES